MFKVDDRTDGYNRVVMIPLGRTVQAGQPILRFDLMTGDQLFVDRFSYHFFRPKVGDGFVFRTGNIPRINQDEYYIKRLVGVPGDTLEVRQPVLYRNGRPITGAQAFGFNANRVAPYTGYTFGLDPAGRRQSSSSGKTLLVPPRSFFAMGDNSSNSSDGRVWGFVPAADVIGRPLFVLFPVHPPLGSGAEGILPAGNPGAALARTEAFGQMGGGRWRPSAQGLRQRRAGWRDGVEYESRIGRPRR